MTKSYFFKEHAKKRCIKPLNSTPKPSDSEKGKFYTSVLEPLRNKDIITDLMENNLRHDYAIDVWESKGNQKHDFVRRKIKDLFVISNEVSKRKSNESLEQIMQNRQNVSFLIQMVRELTGFQNDGKCVTFERDDAADRYCTVIKEYGEFAGLYYDRKENEDISKRYINFNKDFAHDCQRKIKRFVQVSRGEKKRNTAPKALETSKIKEVGDVLEEEIRKSLNVLRSEVSKKEKYEAYKNLRDDLLAGLTTYSAQRGGSVELMKIEEYKQAKNQALHVPEEAAEAINHQEVDKHLLQDFMSVQIRQKHDTVGEPMIPPLYQEGIDELLFARQLFIGEHIHEDNEYVFAAGKKCLNPVRGTAKVREAREKVPEPCSNITATNVRKHVATVSQYLDMSDANQTTLSRTMAHSVATHRRRYMLDDRVRNRVEAGKIFMLVRQGKIKEFTGKKLNEIQFPIVENNSVTSKDVETTPEDLDRSKKRKRESPEKRNLRPRKDGNNDFPDEEDSEPEEFRASDHSDCYSPSKNGDEKVSTDSETEEEREPTPKKTKKRSNFRVSKKKDFPEVTPEKPKIPPKKREFVTPKSSNYLLNRCLHHYVTGQVLTFPEVKEVKKSPNCPTKVKALADEKIKKHVYQKHLTAKKKNLFPPG